ncbi:MAG TPA: flagellar motor protein MotB [Actinomycetota bacterium]|nr:flagellar motor protein MotB [Actinomycetota bacterium]
MASTGDDKARWLITYGDLMTLMFSLFVVLYGISKADQVKFQRFLSGLGALGNPAATGEGILPAGSGVAGDGGGQAIVGREDVTAAAGLDAVNLGGWQTEGPYFATRAELPLIQQELREALERVGLADHVSFRIDERGLTMVVTTDRVLFATGSAEISADGRRIIGTIAPILDRLTNPVFVEGHTDNVPLHLPNYNNWNLSTDRAVAVVRLLQERFGIDARRLAAVGYGEFRPRATNATAWGRALNRRVEVVISTIRGRDAISG